MPELTYDELNEYTNALYSGASRAYHILDQARHDWQLAERGMKPYTTDDLLRAMDAALMALRGERAPSLDEAPE
jgi:hypothetical protein